MRQCKTSWDKECKLWSAQDLIKAEWLTVQGSVPVINGESEPHNTIWALPAIKQLVQENIRNMRTSKIWVIFVIISRRQSTTGDSSSRKSKQTDKSYKALYPTDNNDGCDVSLWRTAVFEETCSEVIGNMERSVRRVKDHLFWNEPAKQLFKASR